MYKLIYTDVNTSSETLHSISQDLAVTRSIDIYLVRMNAEIVDFYISSHETNLKYISREILCLYSIHTKVYITF